MTTPDVATRLCAACGMCCDGVLFHGVRLQPGESARPLTVRGLKVKRGLLLQPCAAHTGSHCTIYDHRPARCRLFVCRQLQSVTDGLLPESSALEKIHEARRRIDHLRTLLHEGGDTREHKPLATRGETLLAPPHDPSPEAAAFRARLGAAMEELENFLRAHFRVEDRA